MSFDFANSRNAIDAFTAMSFLETFITVFGIWLICQAMLGLRDRLFHKDTDEK